MTDPKEEEPLKKLILQRPKRILGNCGECTLIGNS